jgi:hypothetical protein
MPDYTNDPLVSNTDNTNTPAVQGVSNTLHGNGVFGRSVYQAGVHGESSASDGHAGVEGANDDGIGNGVYGHSAKSDGVFGVTTGDGKAGVAGVCETGNGNGVYGRSKAANGVVGYSSSDVHAGVAGVTDNSTGVGIYGKGGRLAGLFEGDVEVKGDIRLINASDCAEDFDIADADSIEPGTVMVLGKEVGVLHQSRQAYDKRVAGVISGAGSYKPGIILGKQESQTKRLPVGLMGKVYCKVDAQFSPIEIGDLLTTSSTPGHAMKATDSLKAFGSVIGKALGSLQEGQGLIPILIALQ